MAITYARDKDFNNVYVDLGLVVDPSYATDSDGAVICDNWVYTDSTKSTLKPNLPAGNEDNPLSFNQFRTYLEYRVNKNVSDIQRNFYIRGTIDTTIDYGDELENKGIFNIRYPADSTATTGYGYFVNFISWDENTSYKMKFSATTTSTFISGSFNPSLYFINSCDIRFNISGLDLQTGTFTDGAQTKDIGNIVFINDTSTDLYDMHNNKIELDNCRLYTAGSGVFRLMNVNYVLSNNAVTFSGYSDITVVNSLIRSENNSSVGVRDYKVFSNDNVPDNTLDYVFKNTIFLGINGFIRMNNNDSFTETNPDVTINQCVFTGAYSDFFREILVLEQFNNMFKYLSSDDAKNNQFSYTEPSLTWNILTLTDNDYAYRSNGWENITLIGDTNYDDYVYGKRDGVGALYFKELPSFEISASSTIVEKGNNITILNNDTNYDTTYNPSYYRWIFPDKTVDNITTPLGEVTYNVGFTGVGTIFGTVYSHNKWYSAGASTKIRSILNDNNVDLTINVYGDKSVIAETFNVGETLKITVINNTNSSDNVIEYVEVTCEEHTTKLYVEKYLDSASTTYSTEYVQVLNIVAKAILYDGRAVYFNKTVNIVDLVPTTYYVDLSQTYEDSKWLKLKYGIYDDFENGSISNNFNSDFRNKYSVITMDNEKVATGTEDVAIIRGIKQDNYIVEYSFVRKDLDPLPTVSLFMDSDEIRIEWDYIGDRLIIYYRDGKYNITVVRYGSFTKDLSCGNALSKLFIRAEYNKTSNIVNVYYRTDPDDSWIKTKFSESLEAFTTMQVRTKCYTGSGLGYIGIQADSIDENTFTGTGNGSETIPYTFTEMYNRIKLDADTTIAANRYDIFRCRNWRIIDDMTFIIDRDKHFHIDVWNASIYGPWMLMFKDLKGVDVNFAGTTLSNGIMYNFLSARPYNIYLTTLYDMWVVWNGEGYIGYIRDINRYAKGDLRADIIGSTIKSESGTFTVDHTKIDTGDV